MTLRCLACGRFVPRSRPCVCVGRVKSTNPLKPCPVCLSLTRDGICRYHLTDKNMPETDWAAKNKRANDFIAGRHA